MSWCMHHTFCRTYYRKVSQAMNALCHAQNSTFRILHPIKYLTMWRINYERYSPVGYLTHDFTLPQHTLLFIIFLSLTPRHWLSSNSLHLCERSWHRSGHRLLSWNARMTSCNAPVASLWIDSNGGASPFRGVGASWVSLCHKYVHFFLLGNRIS